MITTYHAGAICMLNEGVCLELSCGDKILQFSLLLLLALKLISRIFPHDQCEIGGVSLDQIEVSAS